jgi:hypothetical protein
MDIPLINSADEELNEEELENLIQNIKNYEKKIDKKIAKLEQIVSFKFRLKI